MVRLGLLTALLAVACGTDDVTDTDAIIVEDPVNPYGEPAGACPAFTEGRQTIQVGGLERTIEVRLPANPEGAPVVFAWHWMGGEAVQILEWMNIKSHTEQGAIVIAPESAGSLLEWTYVDPPDDSLDLDLFDTILPCLWEAHKIDDDRVYATGMSAGGLMTSYLTVHRSDDLAATVPFSGGVVGNAYAVPTRDLPVMVVWGGPSDKAQGFDFHAANQLMSSNLQRDGHFIVECEHTQGHQPPEAAATMAWQFFEAHPRGVTESPWAGALPGGLPSFCALPE